MDYETFSLDIKKADELWYDGKFSTIDEVISFEKTLGLEFLEKSRDIDLETEIYIYKIVDPEKFFLTKIKYGI